VFLFRAQTEDYQLNLGLQIGSLFTGIRYALGSLPAFSNGHLTRVNKLDGLHFAKPDALRIAVTDIAFENPPVSVIKIHGTEGTDTDT
jgi:hypothetical protein